MKAIVYGRYGGPDVLRLADIPTPKPKDNEVLVKVRAASVNPIDFHQMRGHIRLLTGLTAPKQQVLGCDIAGVVEAAGSQAKRWKPGDAVFGVGGLNGGGFAECVCAPEDSLALKPSNISFEEAAAAPIAGVTALQGLRDHGRIQSGQSVLIDGASGGVGTFAIQIAKSFGADVTAVCSTSKIETALALGADRAIDYTREDFSASGQRYRLILGANAGRGLFVYRRTLSRDGSFVMAGGGASATSILCPLLLGPLLSLTSRQTFRFFIAKIKTIDLEFLANLFEARKVRPVIDRCYPLGDTAEAIRYLEQRHARGKIVLVVNRDAEAAIG
jgi:NADPH:quinone reductase-like Zn-dependent oxidoreductase